MDKQKIQIIVLVVGALVLVLLLFGDKFKASSPQSVGGVNGGTDVITKSFEVFDVNVQLLAKKEINDSLERAMDEKLDEEWLRNPFVYVAPTVPYVEEEEEEVVEEKELEPTFSVTGIIFDDVSGASQVIIGGEFYFQGDVVDGWKIETIEAARVYFRKGELEYVYNLHS